MASPLTEQHRRQQLALRAATLLELRKLWPALNTHRLDTTYPGWAAAAARLIRDHRGISAALAGRYLRAFRARQGIPGEAAIVVAAPLPPEKLFTSLRVTSVVSLKKAAAAGTPPAQARANAFVASSGAATRLVLDAGRTTILQSVVADDRARGWRRVTSGRACEFCSMLAGRDAVYTEATADFASHDHCSCSAEPAFT